MSFWVIILLILLCALFIMKVIFLLSTMLLLPITKGALFVPTPSVRIKTILGAVPMDSKEIFMDLGCGHGQVLRYVHRKTGVTAVGFEINPLAFALAYVFSLQNPCIKIRYRNFWKTDLNRGDIIFCYLFPDVLDRLGAKLKRELKPGARVISCNFAFPYWKPINILQPESTRHNAPIYIYRLPESCKRDIIPPNRIPMPYSRDSKEDKTVLKPGTRVKLTKGYKDVQGVITQKTDSPYEIYVVDLDNGISIVVGPSAFILI